MQHALSVIPIVRNTGSYINAEEAQTLIALWQQVNPQGIFSILYGRQVLDTLLAGNDCAGIRVYNGVNKENKQAFVFAGADSTGKDGLMDPQMLDIIIWDLGSPCPPRCDDPPTTNTLSFLWRQPLDPTIDLQQVGQQISLETAQAMIAGWQGETASFLLGRDLLEAVLDVPGCAGIVVFNGLDTNHQQTLVAVPADAAGRCIVNYTVISSEGTELATAPIITPI